MNKQMLKEKVIQIISEQFAIPECNINMESNIVEDLKADSLDTVELLMCCEEEFGIEINDEDAEKITTPQQIFDYVANVLKITE